MKVLVLYLGFSISSQEPTASEAVLDSPQYKVTVMPPGPEGPALFSIRHQQIAAVQAAYDFSCLEAAASGTIAKDNPEGRPWSRIFSRDYGVLTSSTKSFKLLPLSIIYYALYILYGCGFESSCWALRSRCKANSGRVVGHEALISNQALSWSPCRFWTTQTLHGNIAKE